MKNYKANKTTKFRKNDEKHQELLKKAYNEGYLSDSEFSLLMQNFLVSENGYLFDTGSGAEANAVVALRLAKKIEEHPILWRLIFMIL